MAALTDARVTPRRDAETFLRGVAATKKIFEGSLVCLSATGFATPGAVATTLKADGIALTTVDNTSGADGAVSVEVRKGTFRFANSAAGDLITRAEIGTTCYVVDDQTVAKTNGTNTRSAAGIVVDVDAQGVWVKIA
ncbi:hypothetical protein [Novosphingobium sp. NDB2Meth1]|uniref:hypothetical protein n=1 Tax=Novosphingobium sp. NDB2Meth1 TaxID=1892847 RepID=UPI00092FEF3E|nr:hypothetical protein [Novosphingobium sp. NDB2Meth1]